MGIEGMEFYDEADNLHVHNPNCSYRKHRCTNGHEMLMMQFDSCPSCDYNSGRTELWLEEGNVVSKYRFTKERQWKKVATFDGDDIKVNGCLG